MKVKQIKPIPKTKHSKKGDVYVRFGLKAMYISSEAMKILGDTEYIRMSLDLDNRKVIISRAIDEAEDTFKLSRVKETEFARRIETNRALVALVREGFPMYMIDRYLPVVKGLDGSILVDFSMLVPLKGDEANV